jgi:excisionase family DNA binding protein
MRNKVPDYERLHRGGFLDVKQVAGILGLHWQTVLKYIKNGDIKAAKLGGGYRVREDWLEGYVEGKMLITSREVENVSNSGLRTR